MIYAGIGSRETPEHIRDLMYEFAHTSVKRGHVLRSGHAPGADQAFELGAIEWLDTYAEFEPNPARIELYLPWKSFEGGSPYATLEQPHANAHKLAARFHPNWQYLKQGARKLHARNCHQIFGADLVTPCDLVVCWTPDGSTDGEGKKCGGTGQALRIAAAYNIPVINLNTEQKCLET